MKLIFLLLCSFTLLNCCRTAAIGRDSSNHEVQQQQNKIDGEIPAEAFSADFLYPHFDESHVTDIVKLSKNPQISVFVKDHVFPVKYRNYVFYIDAEELGMGQFRISDEFDRKLYLSNYNLFSEIIKKFGESVQNIEIVTTESMNEERLREICQNLNEYCTESLTSLSLSVIMENILSYFEKPFLNVKELSIDIKTYRAGSLMPIKEIFPNLEKMEIKYDYFGIELHENFFSNRFIDSDVPYLEHLNALDVSFNIRNYTDNSIIHKQIENLLQKHPQIKNFAYYSTLGDFINIIKKNAPNLEHLTFSYLDSEVSPTQFDHVKSLRITTDGQGPFERLSFPQLEKLEMSYSFYYIAGEARNSWITFLKNHKNIKSLNCSINWTDEGFFGFLAEMPNLVDIRLAYFDHFDIDFISHIIASQKHLMTFEIEVYSINNIEAPDMAIYQQNFGSEWHITEVKQARNILPSLTFEKKS